MYSCKRHSGTPLFFLQNPSQYAKQSRCLDQVKSSKHTNTEIDNPQKVLIQKIASLNYNLTLKLS